MAILMVAMLSVGFAACNDDDDESGAGDNASVEGIWRIQSVKWSEYTKGGSVDQTYELKGYDETTLQGLSITKVDGKFYIISTVSGIKGNFEQVGKNDFRGVGSGDASAQRLVIVSVKGNIMTAEFYEDYYELSDGQRKEYGLFTFVRINGSQSSGGGNSGGSGSISEPTTYTVNDVLFTMIPVEGGTFQMGSTTSNFDEQPVHQVTVSSFSIGQTEVTQALWQAVMGSNPSYYSGSNLPVEWVSWNDCQMFITKLNRLTGKTFRLPTEAEWEYAARGGKKSKGYTYSGSNTLDDVAWNYDNWPRRTKNVATKAPNELGIYDMSGNVFEWCQDWYGSYTSDSQTNPTGPTSGSYRVYRGGSWSEFGFCRVTLRYKGAPTSTRTDLGFRLAQ